MNKKLFTKKNVVTIPNLLSLMRLVLIPFICYEYFKLHDYVATAVLVVVSAVTDIVDGIIARKFGMVSDLGKMLRLPTSLRKEYLFLRCRLRINICCRL